MAHLDTCIFCHKSSEFIGLMEDANDDDSYCPFCGATQLEAAEKIAGVRTKIDWKKVGEKIMGRLNHDDLRLIFIDDGIDYDDDDMDLLETEIERRITAAFKE